MKVVVAIDSFKGCLSSIEAGQAAVRGVQQALPQARVVCLPVSDGGEGMLEAFMAALGGRLVSATVHDPLLRPITAHYGLSADDTTAIIEMAQASGLTLLRRDELDPWRATTHGTGQLMADALRRGVRRVLMGLGGSATCDGGRGLLEALGIITPDGTPDMARRAAVTRAVSVTACCDVRNPLCGPDGAARVYGPQKGADAATVARLDERLHHWAWLSADALGIDHANTPGAGAAGGVGFALLTYLDAQLRPGIDLLLDLVRFDQLLTDTSLVITGEGSADGQTLMGKAAHGIMLRARRCGVPTVLVAGHVAQRQRLLRAGFAAAECINPPGQPLPVSLRPEVARANITATVWRLVRQFAPQMTKD